MASYSSPKRKRYPPAVSAIPPTPPNSSPAPEMRINTNIPGVTMTEEDSRQGSPRTKVAYHFQGLQLDEPGELLPPARVEFDTRERRGIANKLITRYDLGIEDPVMEGEEEVLRKRVKVLNGRQRKVEREESEGSEKEIPETPHVSGKYDGKERKFAIYIGPERTIDPVVAEKAKAVVLSNKIDPMVFTGTPVTKVKNSGGLSRSYPSINRLSDSKSRSRKRAGTPPLFGTADASLNVERDADDRRIVDPDRAALTWHNDEITGHDPDDPDDDGEGINGIGFKPTPAEAYTRAQKRRQQMAEYKNREARDARKMRSERRRASENVKIKQTEQETARRVRFLEAEVLSIASTS